MKVLMSAVMRSRNHLAHAAAMCHCSMQMHVHLLWYVGLGTHCGLGGGQLYIPQPHACHDSKYCVWTYRAGCIHLDTLLELLVSQ